MDIAEELRGVMDHPALDLGSARKLGIAADEIDRLRPFEQRCKELERRLTDCIGIVQRKLQPAGSPPPGDELVLLNWICDEANRRKAELERLVCSEYRVVLVGIMDDFELWRVVATEYESELINGEVIERDTQQAAIAAAIKLLREKAGDAT